MSSLTIDDLKSALVSSGISLPSIDKKEKYIELYKKHIAPLRNIEIKEKANYSQLSSDEEEVNEEITLNKYSYSSKSKIIKKTMDKSFSETDVYGLSDDELYEQLSKLNVTVGPIIPSTRTIYQRKLIKLMGGDVPDYSFNGDVNDDYSDHEDDENEDFDQLRERIICEVNLLKKNHEVIRKIVQTMRTKVNPMEKNEGHVEGTGKNEVHPRATAYTAKPSPTLRSRSTAASTSTSHEGSSVGSSLSFDHDRHTPSPRPSLRSASSSTTTSTFTTYTSPSGIMRESKSVRHTFLQPTKGDQTSQTKSNLMRLLVKCVFILILLAALYFVYEYAYSESPLKGLDDLAKRASDMANEGKKKAANKP